MLNHQVGVHCHQDVHLMQCSSGRNGAKGHIGVTAFGIEQAPFDVEQTVTAQVTRAGDVTGMQQLPRWRDEPVFAH
ncbi:hypothetical protein D3C84_931780 [compost metagenome]